MRETAGSAAAPAANWRQCLREDFMAITPQLWLGQSIMLVRRSRARFCRTCSRRVMAHRVGSLQRITYGRYWRHAATRNWSDERTVLCMHVIVGKDDVRQALEKANDTAPVLRSSRGQARPRSASKSEDHHQSAMADHRTIGF